MYLKNSQERRDLPVPATAITETRWAFDSPADAWKSSLITRSSRSRPTNGASRPVERSAPPRAADDPHRPPELHRLGLPLQLVRARVLVDDGRLGRPLASTRRRGRVPGSATDWIREAVFTRSPATIPSPLGADGDRGLAGEDAGPRPQVGRAHLLAERVDRADQVEGGAHRPLGVVLLGDGRAPHRHHRVADELLDGAAVAVDQRPADARSSARGARGRPPASRASDMRREPDEVGEEHRDQPALGDRLRRRDRRGRRDRGSRRTRRRTWRPARSRRRRQRTVDGERRAALAAELPPGLVLGAAGGTIPCGYGSALGPDPLAPGIPQRLGGDLGRHPLAEHLDLDRRPDRGGRRRQ